MGSRAICWPFSLSNQGIDNDCFCLLAFDNMEGDDVIYLLLLLVTIALGEAFRRLDNAKAKQSVGTSIGIAIVLVVSGFHVLHCAFTTAVNAVIICFVSPKYSISYYISIN